MISKLPDKPTMPTSTETGSPSAELGAMLVIALILTLGAMGAIVVAIFQLIRGLAHLVAGVN